MKAVHAGLTISLALFVAPSNGADSLDYERDVKSVLRARCFACHGPLKQEAGLRLDTVAAMRVGGESGSVVTPGRPRTSLLLERVGDADEETRMPPEGEPLTREQIENLRVWIANGAAAPSDEEPDPDPRDHWSFRPPTKAPVPRVARREWSRNPIDAFLAAEHERLGIEPVGEVERSLLFRRVHLDLVGLPPSRRRMRAFLEDDSPDAFEQVVEELLNSPRHGERWARHWMDVWRYSDWYGLGAQVRNSQKHIWHWRDWIVESLNADVGYDEMVLEMLAADELAPTDRRALRATGFLARNYYLFNRTTWLDDTLEHTSKAFLGLTLNCAKCHDHKYDPITQHDYYAMRAIFEPHQVRLDAWPGESDLERDGLPRVFDAHPDAKTWLHVGGDEKNPDETTPILPSVPAFLLGGHRFVPEAVELPLEAHRPELQEFALQDRLRTVAKEVAERRRTLEKAREALETVEVSDSTSTDDDEGPASNSRDESQRAVTLAERSLVVAELRAPALRAAHAADRARALGAPADRVTVLVAEAALAARRLERARADLGFAEAEAKLDAAEPKTLDAAQRTVEAARRKLEEATAAVASPGEKYDSLVASRKAPEGPDELQASLAAAFPSRSTGRRTALARWIVSRENPLAARVAVNHVWLRHFGQPLVENVEDLGARAPRPPLQPLLDWLAVDLVEHDWSLRRLHRLIVTSRAYRLSTSTASADPTTLSADPGNAYHWRRLPGRMESQVVRDSLLSLGRTLDARMGGPSVDTKSGSTRRSLYLVHSRDGRDPFLTMFDDADVLRCYRRTESIVPQQALTLANSRLSLETARRLAARLEEELGEVEHDEFVRVAFETVLVRRPGKRELVACLEALETTRDLLASRGHADPNGRARENVVHALLNHNDFITIR